MLTFEKAENLVMSAIRPEDVFGGEVRAKYRQLAAILHPDKNPGDKRASGAFAKLGEWLRKAEAKIAAGTYGNKIIATIKSKKATYEIDSYLGAGDISEVYSAEGVVVKILRSPTNKDLMLNEVTALKYLRNESPSNGLKVMAHIPELVDSFEINQDGIRRQVNVIKRLENYYTLAAVRSAYPNGLNLRSAAWMWNRMLGAFVAAHQADLVHGCVTPDHFMVCPDDHNGVLIDWSYSVKRYKTVRAISPKWQAFYPSEILEKKGADQSSDIFMSAMCLIYLLGGEGKEIPDSTPKPVRNLLRYCLLGRNHRPHDAWELHKEFHEILRVLYGLPSFTEFKMPARA